jgi:translation initiation factor 1
MSKDPVVYSTDIGRVCPTCQNSVEKCICHSVARQSVHGDGNVLIRRETKGRGGKTVVTISGLPLNQNQLEALLKDLKRLCGTGGTIKDGIVELQGDHTEALRKELTKRGFKPKG